MHKGIESDYIVIKSENRHNSMLAIAFLLIVGLGVGAVIIEKDISVLIIICIPMLVLFRYWIAIGRTIEMYREGCTISFLYYRKKYQWSEIKCRKYENAEEFRGHKTPFVKSVIFSRNVVHKPKWMAPSIYCMWVHPLSVFFVHFKPKLTKAQEKLPFIYCIEEDEFRRYLTEWGVEIQEDEK